MTNSTTCDAAERLSSRTTAAGQFQYVYDSNNGLLASVSNLAAGIQVVYGFDVIDRVTNIVWRNSTGGVLRAFDYSYNAAGMITNVARETAAESVGYGVDSLDRITSANASYLTASYAWDLAGNPTLRIENGVTNNCVLTNGNRLVSWAGGTNRFDTAGNVTNIVRGGVNWGLIWNSQYQLTEMRSNNVAVERYGYDALGRRSWTWDGAATNYHLYNGIHVMADVTATGSLIRTYSYSAGIDNLSAITVHTGAVAKTYYCLTDHAGTVHALADNTGAVVEAYRFDPWGRVLGTWNGAGQSIAASAIGNRYLLHGREYSWRTGLYYFRARYFDPQTARWLSKDPLGIAGGQNLYQAMNCNLVRFRDSFGLCKSGEDFVSYYRDRLIKSSQNDSWPAWNGWDPLHVIGDTLSDWQVDIGQWDSSIYEYKGRVMKANQMGNYAAGYLTTELWGPLIASAALICVEGGSLFDDSPSGSRWSDAMGSWKYNFEGMGQKLQENRAADDAYYESGQMWIDSTPP